MSSTAANPTAETVAHDRGVLRELAQRIAERAALPIQAERKKLWTEHNSLRPCRPMILLFPEGGWRELPPETEPARCIDPEMREVEMQMRQRLYADEHFAGDNVLDDFWAVGPVVHNSGWGLEPRFIPSTTSTGAWHFDPVVEGPADLKRMHYPTIEYDVEATRAKVTRMEEMFGDVLPVEQRGAGRITHHIMALWTKLRGLEDVMMDMYDEPEFLHDAMAFLTEGYHGMRRQFVEQGLFSTLNNDNTYQNSGGTGWTDDLPGPDFDGAIRPEHLWSDAEAQELAQVGPEQHAEFALRYEKELLAPWGLTGYGCCEDLTDKLDFVLEIPNMRRLSISPWANVAKCAERLKGDYVFSWKPQPAQLVGEFNEEHIRAYLRGTIETCTAHGCRLEMILKDTHTCENKPERFDRWSQIAREEVERIG